MGFDHRGRPTGNNHRPLPNLERLLSHYLGDTGTYRGAGLGKAAIEAHRQSALRQYGGAPYIFDPSESLEKQATWTEVENEGHMTDHSSAMADKYRTQNLANMKVAEAGGTSYAIGQAFRQRRALKKDMEQVDEL